MLHMAAEDLPGRALLRTILQGEREWQPRLVMAQRKEFL